ncbi:MAG: M10 family metallopeptidase C-terminal domain-containing protein [Limimaricola soesokkakensis]|uniref:M10 family metallopeptidase C-terminal domain-containing protein n=1 Tax=Limimaricola soesokkakensis TaxID=1343159 RepID=UPI004059401C
MPRTATPHVIADYLLGGYNDDTNIPYTFFGPDAGVPIKADISGLDAKGQQLAVWAMEAWESVSGVDFELVRSGAALTFEDGGSGAYAQTWAYADGRITEATINISSSWIDRYGAGVDSYTFRTYLHEIGHVLGLGHPGPYNENADYDDAIFSNDSWQLTVMSYLGQDENPGIDASRASNVTPMEADLLAIREMWGAPDAHYADGDTIWGIGSNIDNYLGDMFRGMANHQRSDAYDLQPITLYVEDRSGHDRIDFSHTGLHQIVDLRPGSISSVLSFDNNMLIAEGTLIEDFVSGDGIDRITGNTAANMLKGGGRDDLLKGLGGNDILWGDAGKDRILGGGGADKIHGGAHDDVLRGQGGRDKLWGDAGSDEIFGNAGHDLLRGGAQGDFLKGQVGHDKLWGGLGADTLIGGGGDDRLFGGAQGDTLKGQAGDDLLGGDAGADQLLGHAGQDRLEGGAGGDRLLGGGGDDNLFGGDAGDLLRGQRGNDTLWGDDGMDQLFGDAGHDRLDGGTLADELTGGAGADIFVFAAGYGTDTITDFEIGLDRIELHADLMAGLTAQGAADMARSNPEGKLVLNFDETARLMLDGLGDETLSADSFIIV